MCTDRCSCWPPLGTIFWLFALASLITAWVAVYEGTVLGFETSFWFANALILGILSIPMEMKRDLSCRTCGSPRDSKK